jgi:hypothetical protein
VNPQRSAVLFALLHLLHVVSPFARESLVCCSFPLATGVVLFAARYKAAQSETASMLLISTLALAITVPTMLWISRSDPYALSLPSHVPFHTAASETLGMAKRVLNAQMDAVRCLAAHSSERRFGKPLRI